MTGEIYFNRRYWLQKLDNDEQAVKYLELLFTRVGGAPVPSLNLDEAADAVIQVDDINMAAILSRMKRIEHRLDELESE